METIVNCPYCGKEMKSGKILTRYILKWKEDGKKYDALDVFMGADSKDIHGTEKNFWDIQLKTPAYHCPDCRKFIFDGKVDKY